MEPTYRWRSPGISERVSGEGHGACRGRRPESRTAPNPVGPIGAEEKAASLRGNPKEEIQLSPLFIWIKILLLIFRLPGNFLASEFFYHV